MRPGQISPGNDLVGAHDGADDPEASMRPGQISPGNPVDASRVPESHLRASMRPGQISPGNLGRAMGGWVARTGLQ